MKTFDLQREKRLFFAEEIRKKNRTIRMNQIRLDKQIREEVWGVINSFSLGTMNINEVVERMRNDKIYQANASSVFGEWLSEQDRELKIEGKVQNCNWGFIVVSAASYNCAIIDKVLSCYVQQILRACIEHNNFDTIFTVLHTFLQSKIQNPSLWGERQASVCQKIQEIILFKTSDQMLNLCPITVPELNVYIILHRAQLQTFIRLAQNKNFLSKMCQSLANFSDLQVVIKALHFIIQVSFYENKQYEGSIESLLEMGLKSHLQLILELYEPYDQHTKNLILCVLKLINNMVFDMGIDFVFESLLISLIKKFMDSENYQWEVIKAASICLAAIIQQVRPVTHYLKVIRDGGIIDMMLSLMNEHGDKDQDVLLQMTSGLENLLKIGKQQSADGDSLNRYLIKIQYDQNYSRLLRFQSFQELIECYEKAD